MQKKIKLKVLDYVIIFVAIAVVVFSLLNTLEQNTKGAQLIATSPQAEWIYDLNKDDTIAIEGPLGFSVITIQNGTAFFHSSPCDNQICVMSHPISNNANFTACLPNQIFIRIEGENTVTQQSPDQELDSIGY